jgi:hypothetical protein
MVLKDSLSLLNQLKDNINEKESKERLNEKIKEKDPKRRELKGEKGPAQLEGLEQADEADDMKESSEKSATVCFMEHNMQRIVQSTTQLSTDLRLSEELLVDLRQSFTAVRTHTLH